MELVDWLLIAALTLVQLLAAFHALLYKRDPRAALGWVAVSLMFPIAGPLLYFFFGINRVRTRARALGRIAPVPRDIGAERERFEAGHTVSVPELTPELAEIARVSDAVAEHPLVSGNRVEPLFDGEAAYPAMLAAIDAARRSVFLSAYIFQCDGIGMRFVDALARAAGRGVDVRVIVDGVGELYALPRRVGTRLRDRGVSVARFLPPRLVPPSLYVNLRTHRKVLVVDSTIAFTGGMNIADRHLVAEPDPPARARDVHFRVTGPVVTQLEHAFLADWVFCGRSREPVPEAVPRVVEGDAICRAISEGPDESVAKLLTVLVAAIGAARERITVVTPYFLPSREMLSAFQTAALRGIEVSIVLPELNNLPFIGWATRNLLWDLLAYGVRVYYQPPPFAHTKLFLVDADYAVIGSANLDPRSLRLNFELVLEILDAEMVGGLVARVDGWRARSREITLQEIESRPLPARTRDALAWLFSPYL